MDKKIAHFEVNYFTFTVDYHVEMNHAQKPFGNFRLSSQYFISAK